MITYSKANTQDINQIVGLFLISFRELLSKRFKSINKRVIKDIVLLYIGTAKGGFIVAKDKGRIIGFICGLRNIDLWLSLLSLKWILKLPLFLFTIRLAFIMPSSFSHLFRANVPTMAVAGKYRLKGIGMKLVGMIMGYFKKKNIKRIYFQIPNKEEFVNTYLRYGCKKIKTIKIGRQEWCVMWKDVY